MRTIRCMTPFDVVLVPFPFTDLRMTKQRPCLVLATVKPNGLNEQSVVAMMTSHLRGLSFHSDVILQEWERAGLPKPTLVRLAKVVTIDGSLIRRKIGKLQDADQKAIQKSFRELYSPLYDAGNGNAEAGSV